MPSVIGVFDSGFGGLTVLRELRKALPGADYLYFGDTAHLPCSAKSVRTVAKYAISAAHFLEEHGIEMLVVACNTATALAFDDIRAAVKVPVVGVIEPGAQRAAAISSTKKVVVAATGGHGRKPCLSARSGATGLASHGKSLPAVCTAGRRGLDRTPGDRRGSSYIWTRSFRTARATPTCWCWAARIIRCSVLCCAGWYR